VSYPVSACVFIRDCFKGAFALFESLASVLPLCSEVVVMDLGSTDGTLEILRDITAANEKFKLIIRDGFPTTDASVFADLANELVDFCQHEAVWFFQADEIPHENLLKLVEQRFDEQRFDLSFWRIQFKENFQVPGWYPHLVHRVGRKGAFEFVDDGMSTSRTWDAEICSDYDGGWFQKWGALGAEGIKPHVDQMITDIGLLGGFRDNIVDRKTMHRPFWHEAEVIIDNMQADQWYERAKNNPHWTKRKSPYNLPHILRWHVGQVRYALRPELLEAIKRDDTRGMIGL